MIQTRPIYALMKHQARKILIQTAEKNGIPWRANTQSYEQSDIQQRLPQLLNPAVTYPDYYRRPFHGYDRGNLCWQAAFEAESATYSMALRVWPQESLTWQKAQERLRSGFHQALSQYGPPSINKVLDMGCSVGISTLALHRYLRHQGTPAQSAHPESAQPETTPTPIQASIKTIGLDLSPYMLAVAQMQDCHHEIQEWRHAQAESTGFPDNTFDLVTLQFVIHELPRQATGEILGEVLRFYVRGDVWESWTTIQNLP